MTRALVVIALCLLAGGADAAETYPLDARGFVRDWLVGGPYPSYQGKKGPLGYATDFLVGLGGEAAAAPHAELASEVEFRADKSRLIAGIGATNEWGYTETKTVPVRWQPLHGTEAGGVLSLDGMWPEFRDHLAVYAFCYVDSPRQQNIKILIGSDDDHKVWLNGTCLGGVNRAQELVPGSSVYAARIEQGLNRLLLKVVDRTGGHGFCLALTDKAGKPLADARILLADPSPKQAIPVGPEGAPDPAAVEAENGELEAKLAGTNRALAETREARDALAQSVAKLQRQREKLYARIERAYGEQRRGLRSSPPAIDEPARPANVLRRRICLNGDQWLAAVAPKSKDGQPDAAARAPGEAWHGVALPMTMFNQYFRTWHYPLKNVDPANRYGKVAPLPGWPDVAFDSLICEDRVWFRTDLHLSAAEAAGACTWVCDNVSGKLKVYLNGTLCGEYFGNIGIVSIPLAGMREGANALEVHLESPRSAGIPQGKWTTHWGLRGDISLDIAAPVSVAAVSISTSWRKARIGVATELENRGTVPARVRVEQYCVLGNRVRYRFGGQEAAIPPGGTATVRNEGVWTEAKPWGIGGAYGAPVLYDLVTDVSVDGRLVDRHVEPFGFREFWIAGTDFYLNGKRIILQGDVGLGDVPGKRLDVVLPLLRADGINTIRIHDSDFWSPEFLRVCDRVGMLAYAQTYPILHEKKPRANQEAGQREYIPYEEWFGHPLHAYNLRNYERWERMLRNHASVVIAATDNEIFTQAWDRPENEAFNIRNDRLGAWYGRYAKSLNPALVMTRDGDVGTWGHKGRWQEEPPCDTANYHYPDFHVDEFVRNWQTVYDFRPAVFGETLYCSYGAWDKWIGAIPAQVEMKANKVRRVASLYRELGVSGQIYMGLSSDGFIQIDDTGRHNPWGVTASMHQERKEKGQAAARPQYPWAPIAWPSQSGPGRKMPAASIDIGSYGHKTINWFDPAAPSHVRNAVNDAYREALMPMPPLAAPANGECILELGAERGGRRVIARGEGMHGVALGVVADRRGTAWFVLPAAGRYTFACEGQSMAADVPSRETYAAKPGFAEIARFRWNPERQGTSR